jgi:hypothetical protein
MYVNQPKQGQRYGSVKFDNGMYVGVAPQDLGRFQRGQDYTLEVSQRQGRDGRTFYDLVHIVSGGQQPLPVQQTAQQTYQQTAQRQSPPRSSGGVSGVSNDMLIFVTGVVGRSMGSGKFGLSDIASLTAAAKDAFETELMGKPTARPVSAAGITRRFDSDVPLPEGPDDYGFDEDPSRPPF